jgi:ribosomal protein S27AE
MPKQLTPEHRAAIAAALKRHVKTPEHRANLGKAHKGKKESEASRLTNSRGQMGKTLSEETKRRIGDGCRGSRHYDWKGGVPKINRFADPRYYAWQDAVFTRDDWTCQRCGYRNARGVLLHAHHVQRWRDYPELRLEPANGLTLCRECHLREHGKVLHPSEPVLCACGCGQAIKPTSVAVGTRYLVGHHFRGRHHPLQVREAISAKMVGRPKSPETRARMRAARQARAVMGETIQRDSAGRYLPQSTSVAGEESQAVPD